MPFLHDQATADRVLRVTVVLLVIGGALLAVSLGLGRPQTPRFARAAWLLAAAAAVGLLVSVLTVFVVSNGESGTLHRTRHGAPHSFLTGRSDPTAVPTPATIAYTFEPTYFAIDAVFWCALFMTAATMTNAAVACATRRASSTPSSSA